ncbi:MAG: hypothetical protein NT027_14010 [Proteobacteria bacterium]|jgi:hypothetical protein|nr:hypothetical protein [Pseudomonadota bacterium]
MKSRHVLIAFAAIFAAPSFAETVTLGPGDSIRIGQKTVECSAHPVEVPAQWPRTVQFHDGRGSVGCHQPVIKAVTFQQNDDHAAKCRDASDEITSSPNWDGFLMGVSNGKSCLGGLFTAGIKDPFEACLRALQ